METQDLVRSHQTLNTGIPEFRSFNLRVRKCQGQFLKPFFFFNTCLDFSKSVKKDT